MTDTPAQHTKNQDRYQKSPEQVRKRENRNKARYQMIKAGKVERHDDKDVEHANGNALDNKSSNWRVGTRHHNRSYARTPGGHKKNPRS